MRALWLTLFIATTSFAQYGSTASPCIWSGAYADCLPSTGIILKDQRSLTLNEAAINGTDGIVMKAPAGVGAGYTLTLPPDDGDANEFLQTNGSGTTTWEPVDVSADITGVLPLANGGTNKNATAAAGGLVYSDADSMEITAVGTASNWVLSGGTGAPTMSNTTTTGKTIDGTADTTQLYVEGHSTQTSDVLAVSKSDTTALLAVTNVNGTKIRGTMTNDDAAAGFVGQYQESRLTTATNITDDTYTDARSLTLTAGDFEVNGYVQFIKNTSTGVTPNMICGITAITGNDSTNLTQPTVATANRLSLADWVKLTCISPSVRVTSDGTNLTIDGVTTNSTQVVYLKAFINLTVSGQPQYTAFLRARRIR